MIRQYVEEALRRARYEKLEDGTFCAEVPGLRGVLATASTLEECRIQLAEGVEDPFGPRLHAAPVSTLWTWGAARGLQ